MRMTSDEPLIPFRVTVSISGQMVNEITEFARTSCDAAMLAIRCISSEDDECLATGFKVKVEPIRACRVESL